MSGVIQNTAAVEVMKTSARQRFFLLQTLSAWRTLGAITVALIASLSLSNLAVAAGGSEPEWDMQPVETNLHDLPSLQAGAALYVNYCIGCHSLQYQRYERTADDLGIPHAIFQENLIFTGQKIGELMTTAMPSDNAKNWFGAPPPDLTMVTRVRSPEWLYNYLKTFYVDESRPFYFNNKVFPNVGMPHVLAELQGVQRCAPGAAVAENGGEKRDPLVPGKVVYGEDDCGRLELVEGSGLYTAEEYDQAITNLVNFMYYVGEPSRLDRHRIGIYVLLFLGIMFVFAYLLNREYWKDVH